MSLPPRHASLEALKAIEALEARIAPANVTVTFAGGKLTVTGDADANEVSFYANDDGFNIGVGGSDTLTFNGTNLGTGVSKDVQALITDASFDLGAGNDTFQSNGGKVSKNLTIKGGADNDTIKTFVLHVGGTLTVDAGTENDTLQLEGELQAGSLVVDMGAGNNQLQFNYTQLFVDDNASIKAGAGDDSITVSSQTSFSFGGNLNITLGGGGTDSIGFGASDPDLFEVGGDFSITQAAHTGNFTVNFSPAFLRVGGDFNISMDGKLAGANTVSVSTSEVFNVLGKTTIKSTGDAVDSVTFGGKSVQLGGAVSLDLGGASNTLEFKNYLSGTTLGSLTYKGGAGDDKITLPADNAFTVLGLTNITLGDGTNDLSAAAGSFKFLTFAGGLAVTGGAGADSLTIKTRDIAIGGKGAKFVLGAGNNSVDITSTGTLGIYGSFNASSGAGDSSINLAGALSIRGGVTTSFGAGKASLTLDSGRMDIGGGIKFTATGDGDDTFLVKGYRIAVKGGMSVSGDAGVLTSTVDCSNFFNFGSVNITTKAGGGTTTINGGGEIYGKFTYAGGTGANTLDIGREGGYPVVRFHDAVSISSAAATGTEAISLHNFAALAALTIKGAAAANTVALDNGYIVGALSIDTGAGDDSVGIGRSGTGNIIAYGAIKVITGAGDDTVQLGNPSNVLMYAAPATVLFDGGDGNDTLGINYVYDGVTSFTPTNKNFEV